MAHELQLIKQSSGILIPATPETSDILQSKIKLGAVLVAEFRQVRNPAFHRRFFALLNLGFEYWEPTGGAISANERKLVNGYAKFLAAYGGNESALLDAAEQYLEQIANRRVTNGISLCKSFDAYRAWVTVEAGHYDAIQLPDGTLRKHPRSIAFSSMDEVEFQQLYKSALDVLLAVDFITYISYSARGGERRRPAHELCGVMAMKYSWFHHHDCTTEQADTLISDYQKRGVRTEKSLNPDFITWTVSAKLPEYAHRVRTPKSLRQKVWG